MKEWIKEHSRTLVLVGIIMLVFIGVSYAWLRLTVVGKKEVSLEGNNLNVILVETNGDLILENKIPITDNEGKLGTSFQFYVQNNSLVDVDYDLLLIDNKEKQAECKGCEYIPANDIRYELKRVNLDKTDNLTEDRVIDSGNLKRGEKNRIYYELKIWLDINAGNEAQGKVFYGKVAINATQVNRPNGPVLADNMIPVVYDTTDKRWEKADITSEWYNYNNQEWANAVTVTVTSRSGYQQAKAGVEVKMTDILQMWVWIPRYSYTIKSEDGGHYYGKREEGRLDEPSQALPGEIDVKFIREDEKDENGSAQYTGKYATNWYTPPGFTFGTEELSGIWIGKFETGYSTGNGTGVGVSSTVAAQSDTEEPNKAIIKPNVYSWRSIRVSTLDIVSRRMAASGNVFGFDNTYDSHAIKNTEWVLISYLTQSKYGKYGNSLYSGTNKEAYMNTYNAYVTGCSSGVPSAASASSCGNQYDIMIDQGEGEGYAGAGASSTGNITGIYDINGGSWEYVMAVLNKRSGCTKSSNSGYSGLLSDNSNFVGDRSWPDTKYYDNYISSDPTTACNGNPCKGYALNEVTGWYGDSTVMATIERPWSVYGGSHFNSVNSGTFSSGTAGEGGSVSAVISFRQVLAPISRKN